MKEYSKKLLFLICVSSLSFFNQASLRGNGCFFVSIPKCGTHLFKKCLSAIAKKEFQRFSPAQEFFEGIVKNYDSIIYGHLRPSQGNISFFLSEAFKGFLIIRDPRDALVSCIFWFQKNSEYAKTLKDTESMSFDDLFDALLSNPEYYYLDQNFIDGYKLYLKWAELKNVKVIRFENLVGSKGGGSDGLQRMEIYKICHHLGIVLSENEIDEIVRNLFGGETFTFREGLIGAWKRHLSPKQIRIFNERAGDLIQLLGYDLG